MPDDQTAARSATLEASFVAVSDEFAIAAPQEVTRDFRPAAGGPQTEQPLREQLLVIQHTFARVQSQSPTRQLSTGYRVSKRLLDLALSFPALILLSPFFLLVAIAVRLDSSGPSLFIQHRIGQNGRPFRMYKFRTMTDGCGVLRGPNHKQREDQRVTRVGRILRETSIDELPQLLNVMLGQMSLVGPRPEIPSVMIDRYEPWQYQRLSAPQGITGWWQVTGRGSKMLWKHTEDDLYYIEHASFWFDLKLLLKTVRAVVSRNGAF